MGLYSLTVFQIGELDFFKITKLGENTVALGILLIIYTGLRLFGWWLKNRKSKNDELMIAIKEAMVAIKDQTLDTKNQQIIMNKSLDEIKSATIMASSLVENTHLDISNLNTSVNRIESSLSYLMGKESKR